jgi:hypothetical protein
VFRREVVEGQQDVPILGEAVARRLVLLQEVVEGLGCRVPRLGEPDLVKVALRLGLESLGYLAEHVGGLVNPATLRLVAIVFQPHVHVNAVGPDLHVLLVREVATAPLLVLLAHLGRDARVNLVIHNHHSTPALQTPATVTARLLRLRTRPGFLQCDECRFD